MSDKTSDRTSDKRLKSCPFCGGEAVLNVVEPHIHIFAEMPDYHGGAFIECSKCTCAMSGETAEEVIKAWNTRTPVEQDAKKVVGQFNLFDTLDVGICPSCGDKIYRKVSYCSKCGQKVEWRL